MQPILITTRCRNPISGSWLRISEEFANGVWVPTGVVEEVFALLLA